MVRILDSDITPTTAHDLDDRELHTPPQHSRTSAACPWCSVVGTKNAILILVLSKAVYWQAAVYWHVTSVLKETRVLTIAYRRKHKYTRTGRSDTSGILQLAKNV